MKQEGSGICNNFYIFGIGPSEVGSQCPGHEQEAEFDTSLTDLKAMLKDEKLISKDHTV